ncbi:antitoxin MazE-like protein [Jiella marina]|uniref:antitoxin MazE-like protein n=1 Tax=Jiella sp. LLJ827 TaxID=2917712 RepID=UPI0021014D81|nr:antitoxin MazE-like protein [Jiella sp. LLJ827]MCQ0986976.1 antitoxin MazE family protein [Jiella sp. LLJ827]
MTEEERQELLAQGWRPHEIWLPDWNNPLFKAKIEEEARAIYQSDRNDPDVDDWIVQVRGDLWDDDAA